MVTTPIFQNCKSLVHDTKVDARNGDKYRLISADDLDKMLHMYVGWAASGGMNVGTEN
jgi:hypothetical protein